MKLQIKLILSKIFIIQKNALFVKKTFQSIAYTQYFLYLCLRQKGKGTRPTRRPKQKKSKVMFNFFKKKAKSISEDDFYVDFTTDTYNREITVGGRLYRITCHGNIHGLKDLAIYFSVYAVGDWAAAVHVVYQYHVIWEKLSDEEFFSYIKSGNRIYL